MLHKSIWYSIIDDTINNNATKRTDNKATISPHNADKCSKPVYNRSDVLRRGGTEIDS